MPYTNEWDETSPAGSAAANTLDTIIQELKRDLRERLEGSVGGGPLPDFGNPTASEIDPLRVVIYTGTTRPTSPNTGELFFDTDDEKLEIWTGTDWFLLTAGSGETAVVLIGALVDRPSAGSVTEGTLFWANDIEQMFLRGSTATWVNINTQVFPRSRLIEISNESIAAINNSAEGVVIPFTGITFGPDAYILDVLRVRAREATGPGAWSDWLYFGAWIPFDDGATLASAHTISLPATSAYLAGVQVSADTADAWSAVAWVVNDAAAGITIDLQAQLVFSPIEASEHLDPDPAFTL